MNHRVDIQTSKLRRFLLLSVTAGVGENECPDSTGTISLVVTHVEETVPLQLRIYVRGGQVLQSVARWASPNELAENTNRLGTRRELPSPTKLVS